MKKTILYFTFSLVLLLFAFPSFAQVPVITNQDTLIAVIKIPFERTIATSNSTAYYAASGLPSGLTINTSTGLITGTPTQTGSFEVTLAATNLTGSTSKKVVIIVKSKLLIGPFGDSITHSNKVQTSYRYPLWKKLIDTNVPFSYVGSQKTNFEGNPIRPDYKGMVFDSINEGHWGIGTNDFANNYINAWSKDYTPDVLLIHLGTNDVGNTPVATSGSNITRIINKAREKNPFVVVFLAQIIPRGGNTPVEYNQMIANLVPTINTEKSPVILVDQATGFNTATDTWDQTHPNAIGDEKMARRWFEAIVNYLNVKPPVPVVTAAELIGKIGATINYTISASNTATSFSGSGFPRGLSINKLTGELQGWPAESGTFNATISATNSGGTGSAILKVTIDPYGGSSFGGVKHIPGKVELEDFDIGGEGISYHDNETANYGGQYRKTEGVDIGTCTEGGYSIGFTGSGEWMNYMVNVDTAGSYTLEARVASPNNNNNFHVEMDGVNISGPIKVMSTGDWNNWQSLTVTTPALTKGPKILRIVLDNGGYNLNYIKFALKQLPPVITSAGTAKAINGKPFTYTISATANATGYDATGLPAGLIINKTTGDISGTPTQSGTFNSILTATNGGGNNTLTLVITVASSVPTPYGGTPWPIPGKIEVENYDDGGEGIAYHDNEAIKYGGAPIRSDEGVDIGNCPEGGYNLGFIGGGEWLKYTVNITSTGNYTLQARVATPNPNRSFHVELDGTNISGAMKVPLTGSWDIYETIEVTTPTLTEGKHVLLLYIDAGDFNFNYINFEASAPTSISRTEAKTDFVLYPNPTTNGKITVVIPAQNNGTTAISILNSMGVLVFKSIETIANGQFYLNISDLSSGVYFMQIRNERGVVTKKFIVQ